MSTPMHSSTNAPHKRNNTVTLGPSTPVAASSVNGTPRSYPESSTTASPAAQRIMANSAVPGKSPRSINATHAGKAPAKGLNLNAAALHGANPSATQLASPAFGSGGMPSNVNTPSQQGAGLGRVLSTAGSMNSIVAGSVGFDTPGALGGLGLTALDGGVGMGISMSTLGMGFSSLGGKIDDEDRRKRLEAVLAKLKPKSGKISQEGLERLSRRYGLEALWDDTATGGKNLIMAGTSMAVDVEFGNNRTSTADCVKLSFHGLNDAVSEHAKSAASILHENLTPSPRIASINANLDKFADNLERLARLDKLSVPGANCFEAITGIYSSLKRLYEHEKKTAEAIFGSGDASAQKKVESEVKYVRSGQPRMHVRGRVGLAVEYWQGFRLLEDLPNDKPKNTRTNTDAKHEAEDSTTTYSILIECEDAAMFPAMRVSHDWLSERVEKPRNDIDDAMDGSGISLDSRIEWLEPSASLSTNTESNPVNGDATSSQVQSRARFVAKLEPPIILPLSVALQIYNSFGISMPNAPHPAQTVESMLLPGLLSDLPAQAKIGRTVLEFAEDGEIKEQNVQLRMFVPNSEAAFQIEQLPFTHPRQLIEILPLLRQYAFTIELLENSFGASNAKTLTPDDSTLKDKDDGVGSEDELEALLAPATSSKPPLDRIDVVFGMIPAPPHMAIMIPAKAGLKQVTFNIMPNGQIAVQEQNVSGTGDEEAQRLNRGLAEALAVSEDVAVWAKWAYDRFSASEA